MFPIRDHNPSERTAYVTLTLIGANIVIYLYGLAAFQSDQALSQLYFDYAMIPARISAGENYTSLVTSVFLHGGLWHLAGNMLFLHIFGDNLEEEMGHLPFLAFYLACGIGASWAQMMTDPASVVPTVGASGAIAGVMGGYLLLFPKAKVDIFIFFIIFFRIIPVPAWIMLGLWFGLQVLHSVNPASADAGVAYWAHSGGFVIGFALTIPLWLRRGAKGYWERTEGHPPHPEATYGRSSIPTIKRR